MQPPYDDVIKKRWHDKTVFKVFVFFVVTFVFTIMLALLQEIFEIDGRVVVLPQWGPGLAALVLTPFMFRQALQKSLKFTAISPLMILLCLGVPMALIAISVLVYQVLPVTATIKPPIEWRFIYIILLGMLFGALGEALGWRSFLQQTLHTRLNHGRAATSVGVLWGLWHVGHYGLGVIFMMFFLIFTISFSYIIGCFLHRTDYNLILSTGFHFSANVGFLVFLQRIPLDRTIMALIALVWLTAALLVGWITFQRAA